MPRLIRDCTDSDRVNKLSFQGEVFFFRLTMKADDHGGFHGSPAILKAQLFPLRTDSIRETDISRWIAECEKAGLIVCYVVQSKPYVRIIDFGQRLRSLKSKFPRTPDEFLPPGVKRQTMTDKGGQCHATDGLKRREVELEEEEKGNPPADIPKRLTAREFFDQSVTWKEGIYMKHKIRPDQLPGFFDAFFLHVTTQSKEHLPHKELMGFFDNWLAKKLKDLPVTDQPKVYTRSKR